MTDDQGPQANEKAGLREARRRQSAVYYPKDVNRWAIIVGISTYQHEPWNLQYAHHDAEELYRLIQTKSGGEFPSDHIIRLVDQEATTGRINSALRSFLKKPAKEDLVLLYFACHGTPDPNRPGNLYLLTYDASPDDIAGTALPMREINLAIQETLLAERVIIFADTCHSAAIGGRIGRSVADRAAEVNRYLQDLSQARSGIALLTSAEANEVSREGPQWGDGHGVFTHYLLKGMLGDADGFGGPKDGKVTIGELFDYVQAKVRDATDNQQHPAVGTNPFDRSLPIAFTGGLAALELYELGCHLAALSRRWADPGRLRSAMRHFSRALELAPEPLPQVYLELGRAHLHLGDFPAAIQDLDQALAGEAGPHEARFLLGLALARHDECERASATLEEYLECSPGDERGQWIRLLIEALKHPSNGKRYALLIGVGVCSSKVPPLKGPAGDVEIMYTVLVERLNFDRDNVLILLDGQATQAAILAELDRLRTTTGPGDSILFYFSGHSFSGDNPHYLIVYDSIEVQGDWHNTLDAEMLDERIRSIRALSRVVILDTHTTRKMVELAESQQDYTLFLATMPQRYAYEHTVQMEGKHAYFGIFTYLFTKQLQQKGPEVTAEDLLKGVAEEMSTLQPQQMSLLFGPKHQPIFSRLGFAHFLALYDDSCRENYAAFTLDELTQRYIAARENLYSAPFPLLHYRFGRAFLEKSDYQQAVLAFKQAINQGQDRHTDAHLGLGVALLRRQAFQDALDAFKCYLDARDEPPPSLQEAVELVKRLSQDHKHALLVGIDKYHNPEISRARGAVNDVHALKRVLIEKYEFQEADIRVLEDGAATADEIWKSFAELVAQSKQRPALFYFAGAGSYDGDKNKPAIVSVNRVVIPLEVLADRTGKAPNNLIAIFDAGWSAGVDLPYGEALGSRYAPPTQKIIPRHLGEPLPPPTWDPDANWSQLRERCARALQYLAIGWLAIYHVSIQDAFVPGAGRGGESVSEAEFSTSSSTQKRMIHGLLTHALVSALDELNADALTYAQLIQAVAQKLKWLQPYVLGGELETAVFSNPLEERCVQAMIQSSIEDEPIHQVIRLLERQVDDGNENDPDAYLDLGIAYAALGQVDTGIKSLNTAIEMRGSQDFPEAHYHLGRLLLESKGDIAGAESQLSQAIGKDPRITSAYYYYGQAIRTRVEREAEALVDAARAWQTYLEQGAPLGKRKEVGEFLEAMKQPGWQPGKR